MPWWVWLVISVVLGIVELLSFTFVLLWLALAGLITAVLTAFTQNLMVQATVFVVMSAVLLAVTRPLARRWKKTKALPSRIDVLIGQTATVLTAPADTRYATVRVNGETWSAQSASEAPLVVSQHVIIVGASATVLRVVPEGEGELS